MTLTRNHMARMRIGVDLGGTKIEAIVLDHDNQVIQKLREPTPKDDYAATVDAVCKLVERLQSNDDLLSVGVGTPGAVSFPEQLMKNCNSVVLNGKPLRQDIEAQLGYPIRLENDANCFTLSEAVLGTARGAATVFGVIIGTGTGGGIVANGKLLTGPNSIAGEWGHNPVPASVLDLVDAPRPCYCGQHNCIETVLSGPGMSRTYLERNGSVLEAHEIAAAAARGEEKASTCIRVYSRQLARCLATVINLIDPHVIVLGGGLSNIDTLYTLVPQELEKHVFTEHLQTRLSSPAFGDASGALGAACLWP